TDTTVTSHDRLSVTSTYECRVHAPARRATTVHAAVRHGRDLDGPLAPRPRCQPDGASLAGHAPAGRALAFPARRLAAAEDEDRRRRVVATGRRPRRPQGTPLCR